MNKIPFIKSYSKQEIDSAKSYLTERYYKQLEKYPLTAKVPLRQYVNANIRQVLYNLAKKGDEKWDRYIKQHEIWVGHKSYRTKRKKPLDVTDNIVDMVVKRNTDGTFIIKKILSPEIAKHFSFKSGDLLLTEHLINISKHFRVWVE